ncbi:MAG: SGNH/GDSL hydrolase family protein [Lachnospiraceae bacterium]|nr:SGNH/GDSL hydrolase family protein [Lachnospiraceae bacterium]
MNSGKPVAPRDPEKKRPWYLLMKDKGIFAYPKEGTEKGAIDIYMSPDRLTEASRFVGHIEDEKILSLLESAEGFKKLVHSIGIIVEGCGRDEICNFILRFHGKTDPDVTGSIFNMDVKCDGSEHLLPLYDMELTDEDKDIAAMTFEFDRAGIQAQTTVKLYLNEGFSAPPQTEDLPCDTDSDAFKAYVKKSIMNTGNSYRLRKAVEKAKRGEDTCIAFIGGSITQGAGAIPINTQCYAYKTYEAFCDLCGVRDNISYVKAGVGGTPSELGMIRYDRDVRAGGRIEPDVVIVEFAVNDWGDETEGVCYESLVRKILKADNKPAVILLFAVFANDDNLEERLLPVGLNYDLLTISLKQGFTGQFYKKADTGRVMTKAQYFYDIYHPTNLGHETMALCLIEGMEECLKNESDRDLDPSDIKPVIGNDFDDVMLLDDKDNSAGALTDRGDFDSADTCLQNVERDLDLEGTPQFPHNFMFDASRHPEGFKHPFVLELDAKRVLAVFKDSSSVNDGKGDVYVDGNPVKTFDPHVNGWIHCNAVVILNDCETSHHRIEIRMHEGDEHKNLTILGFGIVK